jgi:hypothetical protein
MPALMDGQYMTSTLEMADGADALLTLASPLAASKYNLTFTIYRNYYGNPSRPSHSN